VALSSVNDIVTALPDFLGRFVYAEGILDYEFENISLNHWPKSERFGTSSLWIEADNPIFRMDATILSRWAGKRVVIWGEITEGTGHLGSLPTTIRARRIELLKTWQASHPEEL
jgi:hypothetical protein